MSTKLDKLLRLSKFWRLQGPTNILYPTEMSWLRFSFYFDFKPGDIIDRLSSYVLNSVATDLYYAYSVFWRFNVVSWNDFEPGRPKVDLTFFTFIPRSNPTNSFFSRGLSFASRFYPTSGGERQWSVLFGVFCLNCFSLISF